MVEEFLYSKDSIPRAEFWVQRDSWCEVAKAGDSELVMAAQTCAGDMAKQSRTPQWIGVIERPTYR